MLEEYPESRNHITQEDNQHWILDLEVVSYLGIGRFVLGLFEDIEILENEEFKDYIAQKIGAMLSKANS
jgi:predicted DNA-binding transcriptional regulator YafY